MEKSIPEILYKIALFVGTFLLTNLAIGSEQVKSYITFFNKEFDNFLMAARRLWPFGQHSHL